MNRGSSPPRFRKGKNILSMIFKNFFFALISFLLFSSGANAEVVIENSGEGAVIRSDVSASADTGGNTGEGSISTGSASVTATSDIRVDDDGQSVVEVEVKAVSDGQEASIDVTREGPGMISMEESEGGAEAEVEVSVSGESEPDRSSEERLGVFGRVGAFFSGTGDLIRSIFE